MGDPEASASRYAEVVQAVADGALGRGYISTQDHDAMIDAARSGQRAGVDLSHVPEDARAALSSILDRADALRRDDEANQAHAEDLAREGLSLEDRRDDLNQQVHELALDHVAAARSELGSAEDDVRAAITIVEGSPDHPDADIVAAAHDHADDARAHLHTATQEIDMAESNQPLLKGEVDGFVAHRDRYTVDVSQEAGVEVGQAMAWTTLTSEAQHAFDPGVATEAGDHGDASATTAADHSAADTHVAAESAQDAGYSGEHDTAV